MNDKNFPFTAILGQQRMKEALILNLINPSNGGVLIRGKKGTAKTTAVRALADLAKDMEVVELPMNATEDSVAGTIDVEQAIKKGEKCFEPGLLYKADGNILYVDEINLLEDHLVDLLLDAAATGKNVIEREGISHVHSSRFILVGTMNPEEGSLRPQLLDRFGMVVDVEGEKDPQLRADIIENRIAYEEFPDEFCSKFSDKQEELRKHIDSAQKLLHEVIVPKECYLLAAQIGIEFDTEGHRSDINLIKAAKTIAAYRGSNLVTNEDIERAAIYVLPHRMRKNPLDNSSHTEQSIREKLERMMEEDREGD